MSKHNNVNPDHYKVAGRERQGEEVVHEVERREAKRLRQKESPRDAAAGQTSLKAGSRSMAQKEAGTRHPDDPAPPSRKVSGAFGREGENDE